MERCCMTSWSRGHQRVAADALAALSGALAVSPAEAHLVTTGLGPIYDGVSHVFLSPEDLVPAVVLALLGGRCGPETGRRVLFVLPLAWLLGGLVGLVAAGVAALPDLAWLSFVIVGGLVAANLKLSSAIITALAALLGLFHGFLNGSTMGYSADGLRALIGVAATIFVLSALFAAAVVAFRQEALRIGVQVLGSWTAATGILLLGWLLR
jgi:hydrogenase/urease accessory protein HupE